MAAKERFTLNGQTIWQPDKDLGYSLETTYTKDSTRSQGGTGHFTPMFTVEQFAYTASNVPVAEVTKILQIIGKGKSFTLHAFSPYYGDVAEMHFSMLERETYPLGFYRRIRKQ